jgi:asparagine synthase (glutamine-hydrolysing)
MCGIAGEIRFDGSTAELAVAERMSAKLAPRGPDGSGAYAQGRIAMAQRRLKIMDLSERGQQPMIDSELGLGVVFNGAIYNHYELREQLQGKGYRFFSRGDTEVLLKAYHAWGPDFVKHLNGMFAFVLWERDSGRVVMGRDRLGIKPLYLAEGPGRLRFASTLPALLAGGDVDTSIDPVALHYYMSLHAVVPAPHTILQGVRKLPPASLLVLEADGARTQQEFWSLEFQRSAEEESRSAGEWRTMLLEALRRSVSRRLVADEPVGALLSGGVDSSLIVALMVEAGAGDLRTYSVGFESAGGEQGDEFQYSDLVAQRFATDHERIFADSGTLIRALPDAIAAMSEPMVSHDCVGFYLLSQSVSRHSKVVQSGQGADEVFAGYHWYPKLATSANPVDDYQAAFFDRDHGEYGELVSPSLFEEAYSQDFVATHFARAGASDPVDKALRLDTTVMLVDDPVKRVDNMTMAWGLEARVPFLDHELVELAARIPPKHKLAGGGKGVLKDVARELIPAEVIDRPKGYFPVPALKYLSGNMLDRVRELLHGRRASERGLFQPDYVERLLAEPEAHITPLRGSKLWQIALLETWMQTHGI